MADGDPKNNSRLYYIMFAITIIVDEMLRYVVNELHNSLVEIKGLGHQSSFNITINAVKPVNDDKH